QTLDIDKRFHLVVAVYLDQVLDRAAFRGTASLGNFVHFHPITASLFRKKEHPVMGGRNEYPLNEILFPGRTTPGAASSPSLHPVFTGQGPLDISRHRKSGVRGTSRSAGRRCPLGRTSAA